MHDTPIPEAIDLPKEPCDHEWKRFKERVWPERLNEDLPPFTKSEAYFIVRACVKCHEKIRIDYKVL